jgi:hypothetical protein
VSGDTLDLTRSRSNKKTKPKAAAGRTSLQRFERQLLADSRLNAKGRGLWQMKLLSTKQPFTMGVAKQAAQLKTSEGVVRSLRRLAIKSGLWTKTERGYYEQTPSGQSFWKRFLACESINLDVRLASKLLAMAAGSEDGWTHPSLRQLAEQLCSKQERISARIRVLEGHGLFEVERQPGRRSAYRPALQKTSEETKPKVKRSARTVDEVVSDLFNGSRVMAESFRSNTLPRARAIGFGGASEAEVAAGLGSIYQAIQDARRGASAYHLRLPGQLELVERYVYWLADQHWLVNKTVAILRFDSGPFGQFRRWEAEHHPYGHDPITGDSLWK